jgi:hypothetical protein
MVYWCREYIAVLFVLINVLWELLHTVYKEDKVGKNNYPGQYICEILHMSSLFLSLSLALTLCTFMNAAFRYVLILLISHAYFRM